MIVGISLIDNNQNLALDKLLKVSIIIDRKQYFSCLGAWFMEEQEIVSKSYALLKLQIKWLAMEAARETVETEKYISASEVLRRIIDEAMKQPA